MSARLHVLMVAPPWYTVPTPAYGGIEAMVHSLAHGLAARGHRVDLVACEGSVAPHVLVPSYDRPRADAIGTAVSLLGHTAVAVEAAERLQPDVVHDHTMALGLPAGTLEMPVVTTVHGSIDTETEMLLRRTSSRARPVAISENQRQSAPHLFVDMVHNGVDLDDFPFSEQRSDVALFLGRMSPDKGADLAIDAARAAGVPLVLAGKCSESRELAYFDEQIRPRLGPDVRWLGEVGGLRKARLLATARCLLFPIRWAEPFGMVMVEAMACGTPVVALDAGSVPEVVSDGVTGFVCRDAADLPAAVRAAEDLSADACRDRVRRHFSTERMVTGYERVYGCAVAEADVEAAALVPRTA